MNLLRIDNFVFERYESLVGTFQRDNGETFQVHFSTPIGQTTELGDGADTFFALGVIYAQVLGESYSQSIPCDSDLLRNMKALTAQWRQWFRHLREIEIKTITSEPVTSAEPTYGSFFSGGIDSLFTAVTHKPIIGKCVSVEHREFQQDLVIDGIERLNELSDFPESMGKDHVKVVTNMMYAVPEAQDAWAYMTHGAAYMAVGHLFSRSIGHMVLSSSFSYGELHNWGSHPLTDPLTSSSRLIGSNFGGTYTRVEKTIGISNSPEALSHLSVCGKGRLNDKFVNCSRCQKCIRTMTTLDAIGIDKSKASTFDWTDYTPQDIGKIFLRSRSESIFCNEIMQYAKNAGRNDIFLSCKKALNRSKPFSILTRIELSLRRKFPFLLKYKSKLIRFRSLVYSALGLRKTLEKQ